MAREHHVGGRASNRLGLACVLWAAGCGDPAPPPPTTPTSPVVIAVPVDDKSKLYNLVGRWYPVREVQRLRDDSLTPEEWCRRPPMRLQVLPDGVEVTCANGRSHSAAIARVRTSSHAGGRGSDTVLVLRSARDAPLRSVRFEDVQGPSANITGSPCDPGPSEPYQRFPEFEIMSRQILGGKRCSQLEESTNLPP